MLRYCHDEGIKVVPRGAGTSLSGGALPLADGVLLGMAKFNRILEIDFANRVAVAEPGVTNLGGQQRGRACRLLLRARSVLADRLHHRRQRRGEFRRRALPEIRHDHQQRARLRDGADDRRGASASAASISTPTATICSASITGSEGLLGVVTEVTVRILQKPETARAVLIGFPTSEDAGDCVAAIIGAGIIPGGMEMMDKPAIHAAEEFVHAGYPLDVEALLIVELDGPPAEVDHLIERVEAIARECRAATLPASRPREEERLLFWAGRKAAFPAVGRISPDYYCMDGTIPRAKLPQVLARIARAVGEIRPARRQRVPCRRRQSASADPLRRQQAGRARARRGIRRRHPASSASRSAAC